MILYLKALFEYALWPAVFDCTVRYGTGTEQVRDKYGTCTVEGNTALMTAKKEKGCYKFFNSPIFSGITWDSNSHYRPTCIPPYTSHSYSFFQVASRYDLAFESPI